VVNAVSVALTIAALFAIDAGAQAKGPDKLSPKVHVPIELG